MKRFMLASALAASSFRRAPAPTSVWALRTITPKSPDIAGRFYDTMKDVGLSENRVTIVWDSSHPTQIENEAGVANAVHAAAADGVKLTLALYPSKARALAWTRRTGEVRRLDGPRRAGLSGGEGHHRRQRAEQVPLLAAPVLPNGKGAACAAYEPLLAASYDAIKASTARSP